MQDMCLRTEKKITPDLYKYMSLIISTLILLMMTHSDTHFANTYTSGYNPMASYWESRDSHCIIDFVIAFDNDLCIEH